MGVTSVSQFRNSSLRRGFRVNQDYPNFWSDERLNLDETDLTVLWDPFKIGSTCKEFVGFLYVSDARWSTSHLLVLRRSQSTSCMEAHPVRLEATGLVECAKPVLLGDWGRSGWRQTATLALLEGERTRNAGWTLCGRLRGWGRRRLASGRVLAVPSSRKNYKNGSNEIIANQLFWDWFVSDQSTLF